ncbi:MAG: type II toxin-antitoxin system death-on-curing family toxin [Kordiimonadaceae bacterium]|nr:type II toxin-antitoxin system death-on-curing family toxin [Kordiimonadaceae bacterium]
MSEPAWVNDDVVIAVHRRQLAEHGGDDGVRDATLLESALRKPKNLYHYGEPKSDIAAMAAAYAFGICNNHPFVDGNKRTAFVICQLFLKLNGKELTASQVNKYQMFLNLADGKVTEQELTDWIARSIVV